MTDPALIAPAYALAHVDPHYFESLSIEDQLAVAFDFDLWLRPDQRVPPHDFVSCGWVGGRGLGKSFAIAVEINRRIEAGECSAPALMAPNKERVKEVQVDFLVDTSPPWFRAEPYNDSVRWPNGVVATAYTPESPGKPRSGNHDLSWMCEIVDWCEGGRKEAFNNLATATRVGRAQTFWDTTGQGSNEVIEYLLAACDRDPIANMLRRGTSFDNPLLSRKYLRELVARYVKGTRRYDEEILGLTFLGKAGALWQREWIERNRVAQPPLRPDLVIVSLDPSMSDSPDADEAGASVLARTVDQHIYIIDDLSGRQRPERWVSAAVDRCMLDASGILYERNHCGDMPRDLVKVIARERGLVVEILTDDKKPFPPRRPGTIYVRSITTRNDKGERAEAPAALYAKNLVHHCSVFANLEYEMTNWGPGEKSPNRLDSVAQGIAELAGLRDQTRRPGALTLQHAADMQRQLGTALRKPTSSRPLDLARPQSIRFLPRIR